MDLLIFYDIRDFALNMSVIQKRYFKTITPPKTNMSPKKGLV